MALINVLFLAIVTTVFLGAASSMVAGSMREGRKVRGAQQAYNVAQAGLNEALSWLRKQELKPVTRFDIVEDTATAYPETWNEQIGLVKEWEVDPAQRIWARFEVGRSSNAPARAGAAGSLTAGSPAGKNWTAEDISRQRGYTSPGVVWLLRSRGFVYKRPPSATQWTAAAKPIQEAYLETEVQLTNFNAREAAIYSFVDATDAGTVPTDASCGQTGGHIQVHAHGGSAGNVRVELEQGMGYTIWSNTPESKVQTDNGDGSTIFGPAAHGVTTTSHDRYVAPDLATQLDFAFGVQDLTSARSLASFYYDASSPPTGSLPQMSFTYINAIGMPDDTMVFNSSSPRLAGGGILFVEGNLKLDGTSVSQVWDGLIFVTGNYFQYNATRLTGGVMCGGKVRVHGTASKVAEVRFSREAIASVCRKLATYREHRATVATSASASPRTY